MFVQFTDSNGGAVLVRANAITLLQPWPLKPDAQGNAVTGTLVRYEGDPTGIAVAEPLAVVRARVEAYLEGDAAAQVPAPTPAPASGPSALELGLAAAKAAEEELAKRKGKRGR